MSRSSQRWRRRAPWLIAGVVGVALVGFQLRELRRLDRIYEDWRVYSRESIQHDKVLHELVVRLGYGGFIDALYQYELNGDPASLARATADLQNLYAIIHRYRRLSLSGPEREALEVVQRALDGYRQRLRTLAAAPPGDQVAAAPDAAAVAAAIARLGAYAEELERKQRARAGPELRSAALRSWVGLLALLLLLLMVARLAQGRRRLQEANAALEEMARYASQLLESVPDALLVVDDQGRVVLANAAAEPLFGHPRPELERMTVEELMPERYRARHAVLRSRMGARERAMGSGREFLVLRRDGEEVPVDIGLSRVWHRGRNLALVSLRDVSQRRAMELELREQRETLEVAQAIAHVGSWAWNPDSRQCTWSGELYRILGCDPGVCPPSRQAFLERVHPEDRERVGAAIEGAIGRGQPFSLEHRVVRPDGKERIVQHQGRLVHARSGQAARVVGAVLDVTEQKRLEQELRFDQAVIQGTSQPIVVVGPDRRIVDANAAYSRMSGYRREELVGRRPSLLKSGHHEAAFYDEMWRSIEREGQWQGEILIRNREGAVLPRLLSITRICGGADSACRYVGFYSDISRLKEAEARLERLAHFDTLTGLPNRILCLDRLRSAIARARRRGNRAALLYVDLDGFKQVNDRFGHATGDRLLQEAARAMAGCVRDEDTVARLGGDEFAVVLDGLREAGEVRELAQRLLQRLRFTRGEGPREVQVTASIGIAVFPDDGDEVDVLLQRADEAMYRAKARGKSRFACAGDGGPARARSG